MAIINNNGKSTQKSAAKEESSSSSDVLDKIQGILQVHSTEMNELKNMVSVMLGKLVMIETLLNTDLGRNKVVASAKKNVAKSPFSLSKSVDNVITLSDDDDDEVKMNESKNVSTTKGSKMTNKIYPKRNQPTMKKSLSFSTSPRGRQLKVPKLEINEHRVMPKLVETKFVTKAEMKLEQVEELVSCYVYDAKNDPSEELFKTDTLKGSRGQFQTLSSGKIVDAEIIHMMSVKMNWIERNAASQTIWSLPPSFVRDVNCGLTIEELITKYGKNWMPHFENLKYIYLPIEDCVGNWFLMVAAIEDQMLYHLDPGFERNNTISRQWVIKKMWQVITKMIQFCVQKDYFPPEFLGEVHQDMDNWDMADPVGLVSEGFCQHSAVWVLQWLAMGSFFTPNIHVTMKEDVVRMKVAMDLLLGDHNEYKDMLMKKAERAWDNMKNA